MAQQCSSALDRLGIVFGVPSGHADQPDGSHQIAPSRFGLARFGRAAEHANFVAGKTLFLQGLGSPNAGSRLS
jgi:hypothetical protein